jgi:hypothetical protein
MWSKPQLFICQNPGKLTSVSNIILHYASLMEKYPKDFLNDSECVTIFDKYQIVHLYEGQVLKSSCMVQAFLYEFW